MTMTSQTPRFDPPDMELLRSIGRMTVAERIQRMLDLRERAVSVIRDRLRLQYPELSLRELNLKVLEEIEHIGERRSDWSEPVPQHPDDA